MDEQIGIFDPPCAYCGEPAGFLCDGIVAWPGDSRGKIRLGMPPQTCDRPMCEQCVEESRRTFIRKNSRECAVYRIDYCRKCVTRRKLGYRPAITRAKPDYLHKL